MINVLQRPDWYGDPKELGTIFTVRQGGTREVRCVLYTHQFGWELRLMYPKTLARSQVCRTQEQVLSTFEGWKTELEMKGWR